MEDAASYSTLMKSRATLDHAPFSRTCCFPSTILLLCGDYRESSSKGIKDPVLTCPADSFALYSSGLVEAIWAEQATFPQEV
jgi:hypothetical protein